MARRETLDRNGVGKVSEYQLVLAGRGEKKREEKGSRM